MRRSDDGGPDEIEKQAREHQKEHGDPNESQRASLGLHVTCQQAFYSTHQVFRGRVLCDPSLRLVDGSLRRGRLGRSAGEYQGGDAKLRTPIPAKDQGVDESEVCRPATGEADSLSELGGAANLVAPFQPQDRLDPRSDARM